MRTKILIIAAVLLLAAAGWYVFVRGETESEQPNPQQSTNTEPEEGEEPAGEGFDKTQHSLTDPASLWVIANKQRQLSPADYRPADLVYPDVRQRVPGHETMQLRKEAAAALEAMFAAAEADGQPLMLSSAFRSYAYQQNLYNSYVNSEGQAAADKVSARPGHSEHQTGLSADVRPTNGQCELEQCFGDMPEGKWVAAHAHEYGFIIRYSKTNEAEAGYSYEPWHLRYVGKALAAEYVKQDASSLESFFNLDPAPSY